MRLNDEILEIFPVPGVDIYGWFERWHVDFDMWSDDRGDSLSQREMRLQRVG